MKKAMKKKPAKKSLKRAAKAVQNTRTKLVANFKARQPKRADRRLTALQTERLSAVDQIKNTFAAHQRLSAIMGFLLGGFIPVATYVVVHYEVATYPALWVLVIGGLVYSAISVFKWARMAFNMSAKAYGFVVLLEGVVTFATSHSLALGGLVILIAINGIATTCALQSRPQVA